MDEGRKRVLGIMTAILSIFAADHLSFDNEVCGAAVLKRSVQGYEVNVGAPCMSVKLRLYLPGPHRERSAAGQCLRSRSRSWENEQTCATSEKLKLWCERNKDHCYIPEWLLKQWRIPVDPNVSG
jgi:hypothetical protein